MEKELTEWEELKGKIKSLQCSKSKLIRDRDNWKKLYDEVRAENIVLKAQIEDEVNREWSPVWLKDKLIQVQEENARLKQYIMALEEKRNFKEVLF